MKHITWISFLLSILILVACGDNGTPTSPDPTIQAQAGTWSGLTSQDKDIQFFVTESPDSVGDLWIVLDITLAPDVTWNLPGFVSYDHDDGTWAMSAVDSSGADTHSIDISGTFTASNYCTGVFTAASETYYGGYYIDQTFTANP